MLTVFSLQTAISCCVLKEETSNINRDGMCVLTKHWCKYLLVWVLIFFLNLKVSTCQLNIYYTFSNTVYNNNISILLAVLCNQLKYGAQLCIGYEKYIF